MCMNPGEFDILARFPAWEFFGTLTFAGTPPRPRVGQLMALGHFHRVAKVIGVRFPQLVWVLREERGELGGRLHYHYLIGRTGLPCTIAGASILKRIWERVGATRGFSDVRVYDKALHGIEYITKGLAVGGAGGAQYEARKFQWAETPPNLSDSLRLWLRRSHDEGRRPEVAGRKARVSMRPRALNPHGPAAMRVDARAENPPIVMQEDDKAGCLTMSEPF